MSFADVLTRGDHTAIDCEAIARFLTSRRWFPTGRHMAGARVATVIPLGGTPPLAIALVEVEFVGGIHELVQLLLGSRHPSGGPGTILTQPDEELYEAATEPDQLPRLVARVRASVDLEDEDALVEFRAAVGAVEFDPPPTRCRTLDGEQSNTSVVFDDRMLLKCYRRVEPGAHPELETLQVLADARFPHVPPLLGWYAVKGTPVDAALGVLTRFRPGAHDGWALALELLHTDRADELTARLGDLGRVTGLLHVALAGASTDPAFAPEEYPPDAFALVGASLDEAATETIDAMPDGPEATALRAHRDDVRELIRTTTTATGLGRRIRQHGDLHLGQGLWCDDHWELIDFEGEPARPIGERRRKHSPTRDVAGLLRSIDYAAAVAAQNGTPVPPRWVASTRAAVVEGYLEAMEHTGLLPTTRATIDDLLALHELEKAVYELRYEIDHRPAWVHIPARAILRMVGER